MLKRILLLTTSIVAIPFILLSQDKLSVTSFKKTDALVARLTPVIDPLNGGKCALIRVYTPQKGFVFKPDLSGIAKQSSTDLGYDLYVPANARQLTILHPQLGEVNYTYPESIDEMTTYDLVLKSANVRVIIEETIDAQYIVITPTPTDANVSVIDEQTKVQYESVGEFQKKLKPGSYSYRVEAPMYYSTSGIITLTTAKREVVTPVLKPNFGYIAISTSPESDATVSVDGIKIAQRTPCKTEMLKSGDHVITVSKEMYKTTRKTATVLDGQTVNVTIEMLANFATLKITAPSDATILINTATKGMGTWSGRLDPGVYALLARKDKHSPAKQDIELVAGDNKTVTLTPEPIYGSLDVLTKPSGAAIALNGQSYDFSPNTISKLLIGEYTLTLSKAGYGTITKTISITEGATAEVNETLPTGMEVSISSTPTGAQLNVDGTAVGFTPYTTTLSFGNHTLKLVNGKKVVEESIAVSQNGKTRFEYNVAEGLTDVDGNTYKTVTIGTQEWMAENLKTTKYRNGSPISSVTDNSSWTNQTTGAYCWYDNSTSNKSTYGALYNYYAVVDSRNLCPAGWHVPTDSEWTTLTDYLGGGSTAGGKLKATTLWNSPNTGANNSSGFTALPGGYRYDGLGKYNNVGNNGYWWSSTVSFSTYAWNRNLNYSNSEIYRYNSYKGLGFSVRCLRDL